MRCAHVIGVRYERHSCRCLSYVSLRFASITVSESVRGPHRRGVGSLPALDEVHVVLSPGGGAIDAQQSEAARPSLAEAGRPHREVILEADLPLGPVDALLGSPARREVPDDEGVEHGRCPQYGAEQYYSLG